MAKDDGASRLLVVVTDVTARLASLAELEASEGRFRRLVEYGLDCLAFISRDGLLEYVSPAFCAALGYRVDEMLGTHGREHVHPDDFANDAIAAAKLPSGVTVPNMIRLQHKNGSWRWFEGTMTNLLDDPAVQAVVGNRRDVTDRVLAHERIRFQADILSQVSQPIVASDPAEIISYWNDAAERTFGFSAAEAVGQNGTQLLRTRWHVPGSFDAMVRALRSPASAWRGEFVVRSKTGEEILVDASIRLVRNTMGAPVVGVTVMQDASDRRRLEEQLRHSQKMEAIGLLAGGVAHDFNNLLAVILGFTELATRKLPTRHPVARQLAEVMDAARRGGELTRKLLAFSRKQLIQPRVIDVHLAISDFTRLLERVVGEDIELVIERGAQPLFVRADPMQIEQVLLNLCTNARQAMPHGGRLRVAAQSVAFDDAFLVRNPWARYGAYAENLRQRHRRRHG